MTRVLTEQQAAKFLRQMTLDIRRILNLIQIMDIGIEATLTNPMLSDGNYKQYKALQVANKDFRRHIINRLKAESKGVIINELEHDKINDVALLLDKILTMEDPNEGIEVLNKHFKDKQ